MTGLLPPPHVNVRSLAALHERQPAGADWAAWLSWATRQPSVASLGIEPQEFSDGRALVTMAGSLTPLNPDGGVHGGLVAALIDQVGALATLTRAAPGPGYQLGLGLHFPQQVAEIGPGADHPGQFTRGQVRVIGQVGKDRVTASARDCYGGHCGPRAGGGSGRWSSRTLI